jgi:AcrR family transcriptional regulator
MNPPTAEVDVEVEVEVEVERSVTLSTRERQRLSTRERIYAVAESELRQFGVAGARMSRIARLAGVSRQTVYDHFASMDDVLREATDRYQLRFRSNLEERITGPVSLDTLLHAMVDALFGAMDTADSRLRQELASSLVRGDMRGTWTTGPLFTAVRRAVSEAGLPHRGADRASADEVAQLLLLCLSGFLLVGGDTPDLRALQAHRAVDTLLRGLQFPSR